MEERQKETEKKKNTATTLKLKGNKLFKAKKFDEALIQYMEALKLAPFDGTAILTNIAQVIIHFFLNNNINNNNRHIFNLINLKML